MTKFDIIYADPPWAYRNKKTGGSMKSGAETKYPTMAIDELCALPVRQIAAKNSVIFLWATVPLLQEAFQLMGAWGYKYKTMLTWHKTGRLGLGFWFRGQTEHLLFGTRGNVKAFRLQQVNVIQAPVLQHSRKPPAFRQMIEQATASMPSRNSLEIFATQEFTGWTAIGNQIDGIGVQDALQGMLQ